MENMDPVDSLTHTFTMKGPIRKFSIELLNQGRKKSIDNNSPERRDQSRDQSRERSPPSVRSSPRLQQQQEQKQERRPSIDRWKKAIFSQASRLGQKVTSVTPRHSASSLDVSRSTGTTATVTTTKSSSTATATTRAQNHIRGKENANWISTPSQTPPPRTPSPSSLSLSGSFSFMSSDFLSRENELLGRSFSPAAGAGSAGGIGDIDLDAAASAFPDISLDGSGDIPLPPSAPVQQPATTGLGFDAFEKAPSAPVKVTGDDEIERFEDQFPDIGVPASPPKASPATPKQPTFGAPPPFAPRPQPSALSSTPILQQSLPDEDEPEPIRLWREKQAEEIKKRDEASEARRQEAITKAERSIDQFYEEYNAKKERNIKENKIQEQEYLASRTDALSAGTTWSRICDYVELQNSQSKTLARTGAGTTDLGRFKEVLLRLKREGESAPGAAGY